MKSVIAGTIKLFLFAIGCVAFFFLFAGSLVLGQLPSDKEIRGCLITKMYQVTLCPDSGHYVPLSHISPYLQKAVVLTEDSAFWQHDGFDYSELKNSIETNLKKGKFARGGSTITQQLAKNLFLTKEKTLARKGLEALITIRLERTLHKREILEKYLNVVQFGKDLFGVKDAARFYFNKSAGELSVVESAFLAFLLPSPEKYSKSFFKKQLTPFAQRRLAQILDRLFEYQKISSQEYETGRTQLQNFLSSENPVVDLNLDLINEESAEESLEQD